MTVEYLERPAKHRLAYVYTPPAKDNSQPVAVFLGGYRSDMSGTKARYLEAQCRKRGQGYLRFDYSGHGESDGVFDECLMGDWKQDALDMIDHINPRSVVLIGSSMGGWISLLVARERSDIVSAMIGIAAAPDFTEEIFHKRLNDEQREILMRDGQVLVPNDYSDEPYCYTKQFYEEAKDHLLLSSPQSLSVPVTLLQGKEDKDVIWQTAEAIKAHFTDAPVNVHYIEDGDHRLSRPQDLELLDKTLRALSD